MLIPPRPHSTLLTDSSSPPVGICYSPSLHLYGKIREHKHRSLPTLWLLYHQLKRNCGMSVWPFLLPKLIYCFYGFLRGQKKPKILGFNFSRPSTSFYGTFKMAAIEITYLTLKMKHIFHAFSVIFWSRI